MKSLLALSLALTVIGCGNHEFTHDEPGTEESAARAATSGIHLIVKNQLPEERIDGKNEKPSLNAFFCTPLNYPGQPDPREKDECTKLKGTIANGNTTHFLISKELVEKVSKKTGGKGSFQFYDDKQSTSAPAPCWDPKEFSLETDKKQTWEVTVNQRHSLFYGCLVDKK